MASSFTQRKSQRQWLKMALHDPTPYTFLTSSLTSVSIPLFHPSQSRLLAVCQSPQPHSHLSPFSNSCARSKTFLPSSAQSYLLSEGHTDSCIWSYNPPPPFFSLLTLLSVFLLCNTYHLLTYHSVYSFITYIIYCLSSTPGSLLEFKLHKGMNFCLFCSLIYSKCQNTVWHAVDTQQIFADVEWMNDWGLKNYFTSYFGSIIWLNVFCKKKKKFDL